MASKTLGFLPAIFQTDTNEKFLSATLDQLISEPDLKKVYGYIGRTFAPTYKNTDSYVQEISGERQAYQLEPSIVVKDTTSSVTFYASYVDLLNKIKFYGGLTNNHNRLFENEYYSFDPLIDFDKFINFSQYYWLPNGPDAVNVSTNGVEFNKAYTIVRDNSVNSYLFQSQSAKNPTIVLARGGTYTFDIDQIGYNFWIQTEVGSAGVIKRTPTISSRNVLGVKNNGADSGTITFTVPQRSAQDRYINMPISYNADFTTSLSYSDIQYNLLSQVLLNTSGFDGMIGQLDGKTLVFVDQDKIGNEHSLSYVIDPNVYEEAWTIKGLYNTLEWDETQWDSSSLGIWDLSQFTLGTTVPESERVSLWTIKLIPFSNILTFSGNITVNAGTRIIQELSGASAIVTESVTDSNFVKVRYENAQVFTTGGGYVRFDDVSQNVYPITSPNNDYIITLINQNSDSTVRNIEINEKVYIKSGKTNANKEFYRDYDGLLKEVPLITSNRDTLYYQDSTNNKIYGEIQIVDVQQWKIDIERSILNKINYTSPTGVSFTNGLKVKFGSDVTPVMYQNAEFYVEGVGKGITLTPVDWMVNPEEYHTTLSTEFGDKIFPDYVVINRGSLDLNPWSRNNHWFHSDIIKLTNTYNHPTQPVIYDQTLRAVRPIIEFEPNICLSNNGKIGKKPVDILDNTTTDAFNSLQGQFITNAYGLELTNGLRVIFADDIDPLVRNKIYVINFIYPHNPGYVYPQYDNNGNLIGDPEINLTWADDANVEEDDSVVITQSYFKGTSWWFNGIDWIQAQQKIKLHQTPYFDIFDNSGISYTTYPKAELLASTTETSNSVLKGTRIFGYKQPSVGVADPILGFPLSYRNFSTQGEIEFQNYFDTEVFQYDAGSNIVPEIAVNTTVLHQYTDRTNFKQRNIWNPVVELTKQYQSISYIYDTINTFTIPVSPDPAEASIPYIKVYKNSKLLDTAQWSRVNLEITVLDTLVIGDKIDIFVYSNDSSALTSYQVPLNLDFNAQNLNFTSLTLGQMRNHVVELTQNSKDVIGNSIGANNLRDIQYKSQGGNILQHSAPLPYASLFLIDESIDLITSIKTAQQEYHKFKNKFLELSISLTGIDGNDPVNGVDRILSSINGFKNTSFPWYYSDMVPYSANKNIIDMVIYDPLVRRYEITNVFNDTVLSNTAILVYINSDPSAIYEEGTGIDVTSDILNKLEYVTPSGVIFENDLKIRFGAGVTPTHYQHNTYQVYGVGTGITLVAINNNVQLIKGQDYQFDQVRPAIIISDSVILDVDYRLTIVEYPDTDGNYIPETPTKLGLYPKYVPQIIKDDTYRTTINVIVGHDGSKTPVFDDYRDDFLLELEKRIYNNIKINTNNIIINVNDFIPGKFRNTNYSLAEFNSVLNQSFLSWIGNNKLDYSSNTTFLSNDPFTWNYSQFSDTINGEKLPGSWKAIYKYFFDTETPHQTPWEMLGFSEQPDWWVNYYGPAPYTGGNALLWEQLAAGQIVDGPRAGIDSRFVRPGLLSIIPVDSNGFLRSPVEFLTASFNSKNATAAWAVGEIGPVEAAWYRSSDFPFALQIAMALTKPAIYFGNLIDTQNYKYDLDLKQYIIASSKQHIRQDEILVNGKNENNAIVRCAGYINWVADYLTYQGINPYSKINSIISNFQVNLSYKSAGFTDKKYLKILAEQYSPTSTNDSIIIPNENYNIHLNKSTPIQKIVYSAVIIEQTNNGYSVRGYNLLNPYFTIIPSIVNSHSSKITVLNKDATIYFDYQFLLITVPYGYEFQNKQQLVDFLISYERYLQSQGFIFTELDDTLGEVRNWQLSCKEFLYWTQQGWPVGSILVVSPIANSINVITNGVIVDKINDSVDDTRVVDQNFTIVQNFEYSVMRSPTQFSIGLTNGQIIGLVSLNLVQYEHVLIFDNITVFNDVIYKPELGNRQFRLKLIGQKTNNWDGSLSPAGFIYNSAVIENWNPGHDYLRGDLVKFKSQYYVALINAIASDEFVFSSWKQVDYSSINTGLIPNFASIAQQSETYYDSYAESNDTNSRYFRGGINSNQSHYGYGLIGFKSRSYLDNLGLTDSTQVELYKGFIKQKGTLNSVKALTNAQFNIITGQIDFYEEWGVRVGEYGALDINPFVEVILDEQIFSTNARILEFVDLANANTANGVDIFNNKQLYKSSGNFNGTIAKNRDQFSNYVNDMPTAGYVNINDVDTTIFDITNFTELSSKLSAIGSGYTIWCAKDFSKNWNVFRVTETNNFVTIISNALDGFISIECYERHNLTEADIILIKGFSTEFDNFYQVYKIVNLNTILVRYANASSTLTTLTGNGILFTLDSLRFQYMENVRLTVPPNGWQSGEKVWIDNVVPNSQWGVYNRSKPWEFTSAITKTASEYSANDGFGYSLKMNDSTTILAVGSPYNTTYQAGQITPLYNFNGVVDIFIKNADNQFIQDSSLSLTPISALTLDFGYSLDLTNDILIIGAPASESNKGHVYIYYKNESSARFYLLQILRGNASDKFGTVVQISRDSLWLYITAPGNNKVYAYALDNSIVPARKVSIIGPTMSTTIALGAELTPLDASQLAITGNGILYIPDVDYTLSIDKTYITILTVPSSNTPIEISYRPTYLFISSIIGNANEDFGYAISVSAEGAQIGIGAPAANVVVDGSTLTNAGVVYVYDRTIEAFTSTGQYTFTTTNTIKAIHRVTINSIEIDTMDYITSVGGNTITFFSSVEPGMVVTIETNTFNQLQILTGSSPQSEARHGTSLTICSFNCAIYIGAPGFDVATGDHGEPANIAIVPLIDKGIVINSGMVVKNHNQGRLYGTIAGTTINPTVTPGHSIRLNDFEIVFTGFSLITDSTGAIVKQLALSGQIASNTAVGSYLTQSSTGANVTIISSISDQKVITVSGYNNSNVFAFGSSAGNISINGVSQNGVKPIADLESIVSDINNKKIVGISAIIEVKLSEEIYNKGIDADWYNSLGILVTDIYLIAYLNSFNEFAVKIAEGEYNRVNRLWTYSMTGKPVTDTNLINLLDSRLYLRLNSQSTVARNKMRVLSGTGTVIADLGLEVFYQMQVLSSPNNIAGEQFGTKLSLEKGAHKLLISSTHGSTIITTTFDNELLQLDDNSTRFHEIINSSGSTYLFELYDDPRDSVELPGRYSFTQQFDPGDLNEGDQFGWNSDIIGNYIIISAPNDGTTITNGGSIYLFNNATGKQGWEEISAYVPKVDIDTVSRQYLYNNNKIIHNLQTIDPNKGKILGQAEQEITYKASFDPATYNRGFNTTVNISSINWWSDAQLYQLWWDLNTVRYIDYEQGDLMYRSLNWGRIFPGSVIDIYEWTESTVLPSQYISNGGDGTPMYIDDSAYVETISVDPNVGTILIKYYFWVKNKTTLALTNGPRKLTAKSVADLIENPAGQNIPFAAIIQNNALSFYGINEYLEDLSTVLHISSGPLNSNIIHSEYELINNSPTSTIPDNIVNKLIDSLSGIDLIGQLVPDPTLSTVERYGVSIRPRQTLFADRLTALTQTVDYINSFIKIYQFVNISEITFLNAEEEIPKFESGLWDTMVPTYESLFYSKFDDGHKVLVEADETQDGLWIIYIKVNDSWQANKVQAYKTNQYWSHIDWYATGFDVTTHLDFIAPTTEAALALPYAHGDIIKILNSGNGKWRLVQVVNIDSAEAFDFHNEFVTIGVQDGTIQFDNIGDYLTNNLGFSNQGFSENRFDQNPSIETRYILSSILQASEIADIKFKSLFNNLLFLMINYIYTEQPTVDWIFKTSFVKVLHQLRSLTQTPNYINENQTYYNDYINEVKPYKTKIREYVLDYTGDDIFDGNLTDFDLPAYFDTTIKSFRSPSGEVQLIDEALWQQPAYKEWYDNRTYEIGEIIISNQGSGYTIPPIVVINSSTGSGAIAHAIIDMNTGAVIDIIVDNPGSGYESVVTVTLNGNGIGATAYPVFAQNQIRSIATTIKFDRIGYNSKISKWAANTTYTSGDIISYNGAAYEVNYNETGNVILYTSTVNIDYTKLTVYNANAFVVSNNKISMGANDRIVSYYQPNIDMPVIEINNVELVTSNATVNSSTIYVNSVTNLQKGMHITSSAANVAIITDIVANVQVGVNYIQVDRLQNLNNNAVLTATFNNFSQLITGIDYPGVQVTGALFEESPGFDVGPTFGRSLFDQVEYDSDGIPCLSSAIVDSIIQSNYTDDALGTRPEDIDIVGGAFVDRFSSHAPEELVPGITFDTLDMKIFTTVNSSILAYRIFNNMLNDISYLRIGSDYKTTLTANLTLTDSSIYVLDALKLPMPDSNQATPGVIFVNGERITYYRNYAHDVTLWLPNIEIKSDSILSYGNLITFNSNIMVSQGDYIKQELTGAIALVTAEINGKAGSMYYLNSNVFVMGSGNIQVIDSSNIANIANVSAYPISSSIAYYKTIDTTMSTTFDYNKILPLLDNNLNVLSQIRRGTEGTGTPELYLIGQEVFDGSKQQLITNTSTSTTTLVSTTTFNIADDVAYILTLEGNITANAGDIITQSISNAGVIVSFNVVESSSVTVTYDLMNAFSFSNVSAEYGISLNGTLLDAYPQSMEIRGFNTNVEGNVTIDAGTTLIIDKSWYKPGPGTVTDCNGLGAGTISTWTEQEKFLWDSPYQ